MQERVIQDLQEAIDAKKRQLDRLRPLPDEALQRLEHYYDIEITYASNALEGNTLSPVETTLVIEKGITIAGKPLKDHLEALDHFDAMRYVRELARETTPITESDVRNLHRLVVQRSRAYSHRRMSLKTGIEVGGSRVPFLVIFGSFWADQREAR